MSSDSSAPSLLVRFVDGFLQERNIKWMLAVGMAILLASSLFLVTTPQWHDATPLWQYVFFLGYTAGLFGAGQWATHRLALRRTGTVVSGLTVLLVPILFLALGRLPTGGWQGLSLLGLAGVTLLLSGCAAWHIFRYFLRTAQPTFLACYLLLALAGAVLPLLDSEQQTWASLVLWALFAAGTIKVNRHVFWLTEERRQPRIFGFFPIALLGAQFLALFVLFAAPHLSRDWLGVACVLAALPVLATADAVARVFQQRTGDLVRPLPWAVLTPLGVGLVLCAAGVSLAAPELRPPGQPHALVFAASLAAGLLALVARRTGKEAFAWAMLLTLTLAYYAVPSFFMDIVRLVRDQGAQALGESRLPIAFYGLTFCPLIVALMLASLRFRTGPFAAPLRRYSIGLAVVLLPLSLGHVKAVFPVAALLTLVFAAQLALYRRHFLIVPALLAGVLAAYGLEDFLVQVLALEVPADFRLVALTTAAALTLPLGRWLDPWLVELAPPTQRYHPSIARLGVALTGGLAGYWLLRCLQAPVEDAWLSGALLAGLLLLHAYRQAQPWLGVGALLFGYAYVLVEALTCGLSLDRAVNLLTLLALVQWGLSYLLERFPSTRFAQAFAGPAETVSLGLLSSVAAFYLSLFALEMVTLAPVHALPLGLRLLVIAWCFDVGRRRGSWTLTVLGCLALLGAIGSAFLSVTGRAGWEWQPAVWATVALAGVPLVELLRRRSNHFALDVPLSRVVGGVLLLIALGSLLVFPWPWRVAGGVALVGLLALAAVRRQVSLRMPALLVANAQLLLLVAGLFMPQCHYLFALQLADLPPCLLPLALVAALSFLAWQALAPYLTEPWSYLAETQRWLLRGLIGLALLGTLTFATLSITEIVLALTIFALVLAAELVAACRAQDEARVWSAAALAALAVGYLAWFRVLHFGSGRGMFLVLGLALLLWLGRALGRRWPRLAVLVRPFATTAYALPLVAVGMGLYRHVVTTQPGWLGANSLALFLAAGFYFWRGLEEARKPLVLLAGLILNVALALLWRELDWSDPQFFMVPVGITILALVQLLRAEIPLRFHDPLRYLGALVILVSPTFHIVGASWLPLFTLMVASVGIVLTAIGLRVRALMYTGTAFLLADLAAMLVRSSMENSNVLWLAGLGLGAAVLTLGAVCERHRETLLQRMRVLSVNLKQWS